MKVVLIIKAVGKKKERNLAFMPCDSKCPNNLGVR
jgi:hypothetical protein